MDSYPPTGRHALKSEDINETETVESLRADRDRWRVLALEAIGNLAMLRSDFETVVLRAHEQLDAVRAESLCPDDG